MAINFSNSKEVRNFRTFPIERAIPGSNIKVIFHLENNQATPVATVHKGEKVIPNVSLEKLSSNQPEHVISAVYKRAIDYIRREIVFLPDSPLGLYEQWKEKTKGPQASLKDRALKEQVRLLKKPAKILREKEFLCRKKVDAYLDLGDFYYEADQYRDALLCYQKLFLVAYEIKDEEGIRLAHRRLGNVYQRLGEIERAINHYIKELIIAKKLENEDLLAEIYLSIGNTFDIIDRYKNSIEYYKRCLDISLRKDLPMLSTAYASLGNAYAGLGEHSRAIEYFRKSLNIQETSMALSGLGLAYLHTGKYKQAIEQLERAQEKMEKESDQGIIYGNLGLVYEALGRYSEALECYQKDLSIALTYKIPEAEARAYHNIGKLYLVRGENNEGLKWFEKAIPIVQQIQGNQLEGMIYGALGTVYCHLNQYQQSIEFHSKHLDVSKDFEDPDGQITAYMSLGNVFLSQHKYSEATQYYNFALQVAQVAEDKDGQAGIYHNLGRCFHWQHQYDKAIEKYRNAIQLYIELHQENSRENTQWQISLFEGQFRPFRCLEMALKAKDTDEALLVADFSRARTLVDLLGKKLNILDHQQLSLKEIYGMAARLHSVVVMYSCDPFVEGKAWCWVISPKGETTCVDLQLDKALKAARLFDSKGKAFRGPLKQGDELKGKQLQGVISEWVDSIEENVCRGNPAMLEAQQDTFNELTKGWYQDLIAPIENLLPQDGDRVIIIPDAFLNDLPFALFQDDKASHLFEKCTLITAPSIEALLRIEKLDKQNKAQRDYKNIYILANPNSNPDYELPQIEGVIKEKDSIASLFEQEEKNNGTTSEFKSGSSKAGCIHLACHGLAYERENEHSVFEGALVMTDGLLFAEDISRLSLNIELAFLSACHSGRGKVYREGSIGLPFALLSAGASSVIATRWKIYDQATQEIATEFYRHFLGKSAEAKNAQVLGKAFGQAEALREAMFFAKKRYPNNPDIWGAFFIVGIPGEAMNKQANAIPISECWENEYAKFTFNLQDGSIEAVVFKKDSETEEVFLEDQILVDMTSRALLGKGIAQKKVRLDELQSQQKNEFLRSLARRRTIKIKEQQLEIGMEF